MNLDWLAIGLFCFGPPIFGVIVTWGIVRIMDELGMIE